jgi:DNA-binding MarR family transcriptional regulator
MVSYINELMEIFQTLPQDMKKFTPDKTNIGNKFGITSVQLMTLHFIKHSDNCKTSDIANFLSVSPPDSTRIVETLVKKGFVERIDDEKDRRIIRLRITRDGKKVFESIRQELALSFSKILEKINEQDAKALLRGMKALSNALKELD